jgi:hypothetical protein
MADRRTTSPVAFLGRLTWMLLGPVGLFAAAVAIASDWGGWLTAADAAFFAVLGLMLLGRWAEFRSGQARNAYGEPATAIDVRRYTAGATVVGLATWMVANLVGSAG